MVAVALLAATVSTLAHNKVVVIPLGGDESPTSKTIFVTKQQFNGGLGGPSGADQKCQAAADAPGLRPREHTRRG